MTRRSGRGFIAAAAAACALSGGACSTDASKTRASDTATVAPPDAAEVDAGDGAEAVGDDGAEPGTDASSDTTEVAVAPDPGALVRVTVHSTVAYLLEDLPSDVRAQVADTIVAAPESFWREKVELQLMATRYRLGYRRLFTFFEKGILPLPPAAVRTITFAAGGPARRQLDGHDVVALDYTMTGVLLTDVASVQASEPTLVHPGDSWVESFLMPGDPDLLMQRTGLACIRELVETSDLLDAENALRFYDDTCTAEGSPPLGCHSTPLSQSCPEALHASVGAVDFPLTFELLAWDSTLADSVRIPLQTRGAPDLHVLSKGLETHQILWSYIKPDSCSIAEKCVGGSGWRRLLRFDASLENVGDHDLSIGPLKDSPFVTHNVFEFSPCHEHYHFRFYGDFLLADDAGNRATGDKRAFCLLSTSRYANNEEVPLTHEHDFCANQGIVRGWGDDYYAGLDCQWIDITDVPVTGASETLALRFDANPDGFLCEGTAVTDGDGNQVFASSAFTTDDGKSIDRPECTLVDGYDSNNHGSAPVVVPSHGGMVTLPCTRGQLGPKRDCGFVEQPEVLTCTPGESVVLACSAADMAAGQLVRVCEASAARDLPIACTYRGALASQLVRGADTAVSFTCPAARGSDEPGGRYALYHAPLLQDGAAQAVSCVPAPR